MYGRYLPEVSEVHCRGKGGKSMKKQRNMEVYPGSWRLFCR